MAKQKTQRSKNTQHDRERKALLSHALYRWENAAILGLTLILVVFVPDPFQGALPFWGWWAWLILGGVAVALIVTTTLQDPDVRARVAGDLLRARLDPATIMQLDYRQRAEGALQRRQQVEVMLQRTRDKAQREELQGVAEDASRWTESVFSLVTRLDIYQGDLYLHQRRAALPAEIVDLETRLAGTGDAGVRAQLGPALQDKRARRQTLEDLDRAAIQAESQIDDSLDALDTIYAQLQLVAARGIDERRLRQVRADLDAQVQVLDKVRTRFAESLEQARA